MSFFKEVEDSIAETENHEAKARMTTILNRMKTESWGELLPYPSEAGRFDTISDAHARGDGAALVCAAHDNVRVLEGIIEGLLESFDKYHHQRNVLKNYVIALSAAAIKRFDPDRNPE